MLEWPKRVLIPKAWGMGKHEEVITHDLGREMYEAMKRASNLLAHPNTSYGDIDNEIRPAIARYEREVDHD